MNWTVKIRPVRVLGITGEGTNFDIAQGILYSAGLAAAGPNNTPVQAPTRAQIINLSLGGEGESTTERAAMQYALDKGVFIAIAAGNAHDSGNPPQYPAFYAPGMAGVMAVAATNRSGKRASYSSSGSYVEIAAPGGDPLDSDARGSGFIFQSTYPVELSDPSAVLFPRFDRYDEVGYAGTSMASPHVAGVAALLYSQGITKPAAIEAAIRKTARFLGTPGASDPSRNDDFGAGLIQPRAALFGLGLRK